MESVSVATLKKNLSRCLAAAENGRELAVTSHGDPIARIVPMEKAFAGDLEIIAAEDLLRDRRRR
jgi:prevent-host-death family protein